MSDLVSHQNHLWIVWLVVKSFLKGEREVILVNHWGRWGSHHHSPLPAGLLIFCDFSLDIILFTQFVWKEIWSSVNCLFFISTSWIYGMNEQISQGIMWPKGLKDILGPNKLNKGVSDFKVCKKAKGTPVENYFLHRALACQKLFTNPHLSEHNSVSMESWANVHFL